MKVTNNARALECTGPDQLELVYFNKPVPADGEALLKIELCGICGSDIHGIEGKRSIKYPFIPGHEIVAKVESLGKHADRSIKIFGSDELKIGDRVVINPRTVCGKCYYCKNFPHLQELCLNTITSTGIGSSKSTYLFGGWAEYIYILPNSELIKLPDTLASETAVLA